MKREWLLTKGVRVGIGRRVESKGIEFDDSLLEEGMYLSTEEDFYLIEQDNILNYLIEE